MTRYDRNVDEIFLLEDNTSSAERGYVVGVGDIHDSSSITISLHRLNGTGKTTLARKTYKSGGPRSKRAARLEMAAALLAKTAGESPRPIIVAGTSYGSANAFLQMMADRTLPYVVQIRPSTTITLLDGKQEVVLTAGKALDHADWKHLKIRMPDECAIECSAAKLGSVSLPLGRGKLFAAQVGGIPGIHRGTIIGVSSFDAPLADLVRLAAYTRWVHRAARVEKRASAPATGTEPSGEASLLKVRSNIALARIQDARTQVKPSSSDASLKGCLNTAGRILNVVELFSGAGGMGLGFLLGGGANARYRIVYSGEANPIFVDSLRSNHRRYERITRAKTGSRTPPEVVPLDLRESKALRTTAATAREAGDVHILIGGPQTFF